MKKTMIAIFLLTAGIGAQAQMADTVKVYRPDSVLVISNNDRQSIVISGSETNKDYYYSSDIEIPQDARMNISSMENKMDFDVSFPFLDKINKKETSSRDNPRFSVQMSPFMTIGLLNPIDAPSQLNMSDWHNSEVGFPSILKLAYDFPGRQVQLSINGGYNIKRFKTRSDIRFIGENGNLVLGQTPSGATKTKSMITVHSWTLSPLISVKNSRNTFKIVTGPMVNFNRPATTITKYHLDDKKHKEKDGKVDTVPVTVDLLVAFDIEDFLDIYVKFAPKSVLKTDNFPSFTTWSIGFCFDL
ncbi:MAG: hypothetical protein IJL91_09005 [Bacteroidales bacterium]|nr:hypothetical protein [Bacteroidales bacterium]